MTAQEPARRWRRATVRLAIPAAAMLGVGLVGSAAGSPRRMLNQPPEGWSERPGDTRAPWREQDDSRWMGVQPGRPRAGAGEFRPAGSARLEHYYTPDFGSGQSTFDRWYDQR